MRTVRFDEEVDKKALELFSIIHGHGIPITYILHTDIGAKVGKIVLVRDRDFRGFYAKKCSTY